MAQSHSERGPRVYAEARSSAAITLDLADFPFVSLDLEGGRLIAGFARALNLSTEHLAQAAALST